MLYKSTRGEEKTLTAGQAILKGIAGDGGLYVPERIPVIEYDASSDMSCGYRELAFRVLKLYLTDYSEQEIRDCVDWAYDDKFDTEQIAPLVERGGHYFLELFHGRTLAFKDMALSILPHLLKTAAGKYSENKRIVILTATSGDTGKAAMEGFAGVDGVSVLVFYPENGVSEVQKLQMITSEGRNTLAIGVRGNFDDAQSGVKEIFADASFNQMLNNRGYVLSSANSINIGRLLPQIVYYFHAYSQMVRMNVISPGEEINFTVPTGNFGNILAGYYAGKMGLPIYRLICASNENRVLYDFFRTGHYDRNRELLLTSSPSMDILISSNLERLLYHTSHSAHTTNALMEELSREGRYTFDVAGGKVIGEYAAEEEAFRAIKEMHGKNYIMDTHTAVAYAASCKYEDESSDKRKNVIIATASPYKFPEAVCCAIDERYDGRDPFELMSVLSELTGTPIPTAIRELEKKERRLAICEKHEMSQAVEKYISYTCTDSLSYAYDIR